METDEENDVDDISKDLSKLFEPLALNTNLKIGTKPKERSTSVSRRNEEKDSRSSNFSKNKSDSKWRSNNAGTNSWRTKNETATKKWTRQERKYGHDEENAGATKKFLRTDNKDRSYRNKHSDNENIFDAKQKRSSRRSQLNLTLQEILKMESQIPENVIISLIEKIEEFKRIIGGALCFEDVILLLRVFERICSSHFDENRGKLITSIVNAKFHEKILEYLLLLATQNCEEKAMNKIFWDGPERFWNNLLIFYENIFEFMPATACDLLPKIVKATILNIKDMEKYNDINLSTNVKENLEKFQEKLTTTIEKQSKNNVQEQEPPDSFRYLSIYPTVEEVTTQEVPFIRPIIKNGAYQSVEHYLDVQFRLLKEDFTASLRNGICTYLQKDNSKSEQQFDVRIYENVKFIAPHVTQDRVASLLQYTNEINKRSIEESSKRFIYGSLLCFTSDNFEDISFGTVVDNDIKYLKKGQIIVDIQEGYTDFNKKYTMVECTVFFEPYYQVLTAMKNIHEYNFPFKDYIIDVTSQTKPPKYITNSTTAHFMENKYKLRILSPETWPKADQVGLNDSQMKAFHSALTQEFCIIQGPPGTGKTYTTLRIVEFLLRNARELRYDGPIFVICFTNHALDQFLEGILLFTDHLLRIGGQSKSNKMEKYSLKNYRDMLRYVVKRKYSRKFDATIVNRYSNSYDQDYYYFGNYYIDESDLYRKYYHPDEHKYDFSDYISGYHIQNNDAASDYFINVYKLEKYKEILDIILEKNGVISFSIFNDYNVIDKTSPFYNKSKEEIMDWLLEHNKEVNKKEIQDDVNQDDQIDYPDIDIDIQKELYGERHVSDNFDYEIGMHFDRMYLMRPTDFIDQINKDEAKYAEVLSNEKDTDIKTKSPTYYQKRINSFTEKLHYLSMRLRQCKTETEIIRPDLSVTPELMTPNERWNLYRYWLEQLRIRIYDEISSMDEEFRRSHRRYQEISRLKDIYIMRKMKVIGMTTTGAARHQKLLKILQCPIVIAEEAAEVLESHIVVSLTKDCQHLILIGDHQQLRPNTAQYHLAIKYNLEISLFERMVQNGIHCQRLNIQHRMRPEFAKLIVPAIYPNLENSNSVEKLPPIKGVVNNLFFINHSVFEDHVYNSSSHKNIFEAKYILNLAKYFIKQGYAPEEITILTTYKGQMYLMSDERKRLFDPDLNSVRITVVDNFQGEENKIILLSLVRSNKEANIGFLKTENRVCVALSRAKEGFFIIGNMSNLEQSSKIWPKIKKVLRDQNAIGEFLTLQCQMHSTRTVIGSWEDFEKIPEGGGCNIPCNTTLECTHICKLMCHPYDQEHKEYKCNEKCIKKCPRNHICPEQCFRICPPCQVLIKTDLSCGHRQYIPCSIPIEKYNCKAKVNVELLCGHTVAKNCYEKPENVKCSYLCEKVLDCGHTVNFECHNKNNIERFMDLCLEPCRKFRKGCSTNEHFCTLLCHEECEPCTEIVQKRRETCTHKVRIACNEEISGICREKCRKILPCGHHCPKLCFEDCGDCFVTVTKTIEECGHSVTTRCRNEVDLKMCNEQCVKLLKCGHPCKNQCNEPCAEECKVYVTYKDCSDNMVTGFCHLEPKTVDATIANNDNDNV